MFSRLLTSNVVSTLGACTPAGRYTVIDTKDKVVLLQRGASGSIEIEPIIGGRLSLTVYRVGHSEHHELLDLLDLQAWFERRLKSGR